MDNFWSKLNKPIYALSPMAGITDSAFRQICKSFGADVVYSEMASATALALNPRKTLEMLYFAEKERPYVVQLFGSNPEHFIQAVKIVEEKIKPDGIDINFGCPVKKVQKQAAGAVLMNNLPLAKKIIQTIIANTNLPVSIKTRSQVKEITILEFLKFIQGLDIKAIMIHGRSLHQGHSGPVDFNIIKKARQFFPGIILANGGVKDKASADESLLKTQADGIGIGQGALGRPWLFTEVKSKKLEVRSKDIIRYAWKQVRLAEKIKGNQGIIEMRKHLGWYVQGWSGARQLRNQLVKVKTLPEIENLLNLLLTTK
jgi:tRNA-dihydrouridine synthase B